MNTGKEACLRFLLTHVTPPKTNMEPKNDGFIGISSSRGSFSGSMLVFGGVTPFLFGDVEEIYIVLR